VAACTSCAHEHIAYNSCRNRHCPKCQSVAARDWLERRAADLLPVPYYHVVFTLPGAIADIAYRNKAVLYDLLLRASAATMLTIAADPKHLGARIGMTSVLHTWGSAMTHHPHVHVIVPGGGLSPNGTRWIACRPGFFLPVRVLSRLFRRLFLTGLEAAYRAGRLRFFGKRADLTDPSAFAAHIAPLSKSEWVVYAKAPFGGPEAVLAYLSRYTHRVAIANSRLVAADANTVTFRWKDYRAQRRSGGRGRQKLMRLETSEFIRRFLLHVLPRGFHRIRHYGLFANSARVGNIATIRRLLDAAPPDNEQTPASEAQHTEDGPSSGRTLHQPCPACGGPMIVIETFDRGQTPRARAPPVRSAA
jgi:predicted RNA-binding Zn-ribbon protein involved in translation (DUF1610 family)